MEFQSFGSVRLQDYDESPVLIIPWQPWPSPLKSSAAAFDRRQVEPTVTLILSGGRREYARPVPTAQSQN
jgi:hypothetical protein